MGMLGGIPQSIQRFSYILIGCMKSYECECISGFMSTSDVLNIECNLRTFKTSRVTINPEMHYIYIHIYIYIYI